MHISRPAFLRHLVTLGLALTGLLAFGGATARPAAAQQLMYQFSGVTFNDGAVATGFFDFNPTTSTFEPYNFTTTNGTSDGLTGVTYQPGPSQNFFHDEGSAFTSFGLNSNSVAGNFIGLTTTGAATSSGIYSLIPGTVLSTFSFQASGEFAPTARSINAGFLIVTPAAVPEASTTTSLGLLLALGLGGVMIAKRKKVHAA